MDRLTNWTETEAITPGAAARPRLVAGAQPASTQLPNHGSVFCKLSAPGQDAEIATGRPFACGLQQPSASCVALPSAHAPPDWS